MNDVVAAFNDYFEVIDADSPELLREAFRVRYQVLCVGNALLAFKRQTIPKAWKVTVMTATHSIYFCGTAHRINLSELRA